LGCDFGPRLRLIQLLVQGLSGLFLARHITDQAGLLFLLAPFLDLFVGIVVFAALLLIFLVRAEQMIEQVGEGKGQEEPDSQ
jgi:hypothetical protein